MSNSSGSRVSIPNNVRKTIQNIKEIAGNHGDDEIYAMLKECSMDPNETADKLLLQDTFHEVRSKRDKRKENMSNRESADARWRPGTQGRGGRGGRGNNPPRYISQDAGDGKNVNIGKENGVKQGSEKGGTPSVLPVSQAMESKGTASVSSSVPVMANGAINVSNGSSIHGRALQMATGSGTNSCEGNSPVVVVNNLRTGPVPPGNPKGAPPSGVTIARKQATPSLSSLPSVLGVYSSASDPVLVPSIDSRVSGAVGTIKREVRVRRAAAVSNATIPAETISTTSQDFADAPKVNKLVSDDITNSKISTSTNEQAVPEMENSFLHEKMPSKSSGVENNQHSEPSEPSSVAHGGSSVSRPSSNYGSRSQQLIGSQKAVGPSKEWKPKQMNSNTAPTSGEVSSKVVPVTDDVGAQSLPILNALESKEANSMLQKKPVELYFSESHHVIIPNHLQVPESERTGLSFGSFDANFGLRTSYSNGPDTEKISTPLSESSQEVDEIAEEPSSSNQNVFQDAQEDGEYSDNSQSPMEVPENVSTGEANVSSLAVSDHDQSTSENVLPPGGPQYSVVHTVPTYSSYGMMPPPMLGAQFAPFDGSEPQARDASRLPGFVVQQPFDPSVNYYTQFYRSGGEGDGRFSPLLTPGAASKYNGNVALLSSQSGQPPQELQSGNSMVLSTASPTPLVTQAAGVVQSSIAVPQQPVPVFRQSPGLHMSHFPPNYLPYNSYYPFFVPPPTFHQIFSNTTFPQQPPSGNVYPPPAATAASGIKYSLPQFKAGTNTGSTTHIGMQPGYTQFSSPAGYSPSPAVTTGNSTDNEDLAAAQFKENNVYITGQQSEGGSGVWIPAPGRDMSGMQASSFYNLPPQGQHVTFAPTQAGHPAFAGVYHPTQTMAAATVHPLLQQSQTMAGAVEMVGPPAGVYQQPQRPQINWTNTY